jgi:hypothetical protein
MSDPHSTFSQGLDMPMLAVTGIVGAVLVYVSVVGTQAYYDAGVQAEEQTKLIDVRYDALEDLREQQGKDLARVHWVDAEAGIATIPIDQGIQQVISQYASGER